MEYKIRTQPEEWACTKFCRIALTEDSVANFILWLCDHSPEQVDARLAADRKGEPLWFDLVETIWGWDAPRQRLAKLLWQFLNGGASDVEFRNRFTFAIRFSFRDCATLLAPIQERLRWVIEGLCSRREEDVHLGQTDWGEHWWLPADQTRFVRTQLKLTHAELIEQSSDYEDAVSDGLCFYIRHVVQAIGVPCDDPERVYIGERRGSDARAFVWVQDTKGNRYPLKHALRAYLEADGTGFEWGYGGHGPGALTRCILADALDGDLALADEVDRIEPSFFEKFILHYPRWDDLRITRADVLKWVKDVGRLQVYKDRRNSVAQKLETHASTIAEREKLLIRIVETGGLRSQRFDIVPETFESALYLDLIHMLERGGTALRCSGCNLPIPYDHSGRANKQRARSQNGQAIYHPECFAERTRMRKKAYWQRRAKLPQFREQERKRAREYRQLS